MEKFPLYINGKISGISVPPFQKQLFVDVLQSKCSPVPFETITDIFVILFTLTRSST